MGRCKVMFGSMLALVKGKSKRGCCIQFGGISVNIRIIVGLCLLVMSSKSERPNVWLQWLFTGTKSTEFQGLQVFLFVTSARIMLGP